MNRDVGGYAESAISVGYVAFGMRVGDGDGAAEDDQSDAKDAEEKSPTGSATRV